MQAITKIANNVEKIFQNRTLNISISDSSLIIEEYMKLRSLRLDSIFLFLIIYLVYFDEHETIKSNFIHLDSSNSAFLISRIKNCCCQLSNLEFLIKDGKICCNPISRVNITTKKIGHTLKINSERYPHALTLFIIQIKVEKIV